MKKPIVAFMYDFDKTLCTKDMQEYSFIPKIGMTAKKFWEESTALAKREKMDRILAYMHLMIKKSKVADKPISRKDFVDAGKGVEFFPGVTDWFKRINAFGKTHHLEVEHYIISSGLKEIIEGTPIKNNFEEIYASEFLYDQDNRAVWPKMAINYTGKTQFLFRINKGVLDVSEDEALNAYTPENDRRIPFSHMIFIGDGITDIPCMRLVKVSGGKSIAVYPPRKKAKVEELLKNKRVDFIIREDQHLGGIILVGEISYRGPNATHHMGGTNVWLARMGL